MQLGLLFQDTPVYTDCDAERITAYYVNLMGKKISATSLNSLVEKVIGTLIDRFGLQEGIRRFACSGLFCTSPSENVCIDGILYSFDYIPDFMPEIAFSVRVHCKPDRSFSVTVMQNIWEGDISLGADIALSTFVVWDASKSKLSTLLRLYGVGLERSTCYILDNAALFPLGVINIDNTLDFIALHVPSNACNLEYLANGLLFSPKEVCVGRGDFSLVSLKPSGDFSTRDLQPQEVPNFVADAFRQVSSHATGRGLIVDASALSSGLY